MPNIILALEKEVNRLRAEKNALVFPCPDCKKNMANVPWDNEQGGECNHCHAFVSYDDMEPYILKSRDLWQDLTAKSQELSDARNLSYVTTLRTNGLDAWNKFLYHDFRIAEFTDGLYRMLMMTFGHIAMYDRMGFYSYHFDTDEAIIRTLGRMIDYHDERSDGLYTALENEICEVIRETDVLTKVRKRRADEVEIDERRLLAVFKAKYEGTP